MKNIITLVTITVLLGMSSLVYSDVEATPRCFWEFEETEGTVAFDSSGNGYNGTIHSDPGRVAGKEGNCYDFDGEDDYVEIVNCFGVGGADARTVAAYIKADEDLANNDKKIHTIVSWGKAEAVKKWMLMLEASTGQLALATYGGKITGGPDLEDGQWHHVAVVLPVGANNMSQVKMYVDSLEIYTNAYAPESVVINTARTENVLIGAMDTDAAEGIQTPSFYFSGAIDDVRIYYAGLTNDQIATTFGDIPTIDVTPECFLEFEETEGTVAFDSSGNGYDGAIHSEPGRIAGKLGNCYGFDGVEDYVEIAGYAGIGGANARTVAAYIKADEDLANNDKKIHAIVSWGKAEAFKKWAVMLDANSGQLALATYGGQLIGGPDLEDGQWHHVAVVLPAWSNNINQIKMYVDRFEIETNANEQYSVIDTALTESVLIGAIDTDAAAGPQTPNFFFSGAIDDVRIYDAGLTNDLIAAIFDKKLAGIGTESEPYLIEDYNDYLKFCDDKFASIYWKAGTYTRLDSDLDLDPALPGREVYSQSAIAPDADVEACFHQGLSYSGIFNGNGNKISNLVIDSNGQPNCYLGLFGKLGSGAEVKNINIVNCNITGGDDSDFIGGICGKNSGGAISNCSAEVTINSGKNSFGLGGVCGENDHGVISNCHGSGYLNGYSYVGGVCGYNYYGTITDSSTSNTVNGIDTAGNLCGGNHQGTISKCFAKGSVSGEDYLGGLCGYNYKGTIANCYATAPVDNGYYFLGGLCGYNYYGSVSNSYSTGAVYSGSNYVGGLFAASYKCNINSGFWNSETSGTNFSDGGLGLTTSEMQDIDTFLDAGWDFVDETGNGVDDIWVMNGYPSLFWNNYVFDLEELSLFAEYWLAGSCSFGTDCYYFDYNDDTKVDMSDFVVIASKWLETVEIKGPPEPNPLSGYWKLDEASGSTAIDSSGYEHNGIVHGEQGRAAGIVDGCYVFDGVEDYIEVAGYVGVGRSSARTVAAWIKADSDLTNSEKNIHTIVSWGAAESRKKWMVIVDDYSGQLALAVYGARLKGGPDLEDGLWHHVAVVLPSWADNLNQVKMYVDGVEIATNAGSLDAVIDTATTEAVLIGAVDTDAATGVQSPAFFFKGEMDEVRIYNAAISEAEISEL